MPSYFADGEVVTIGNSTKLATKKRSIGPGTSHSTELHCVGRKFYELSGATLALVDDPEDWLEGMQLESDNVEKVRKAFQSRRTSS